MQQCPLYYIKTRWRQSVLYHSALCIISTQDKKIMSSVLYDYKIKTVPHSPHCYQYHNYDRCAFSISTGWFKTVNLTPSITISKRRRQWNSLLNIAPSTKWIKTVRQTLSFAISTRWKQCTRPSILPPAQNELRQCVRPSVLPPAQNELRQCVRPSVLPSVQDENSAPDPQYCRQYKMN